MRFFNIRTIARIFVAAVAGAGFALGAVNPASADDTAPNPPAPQVPVVVVTNGNWPWG
ncbi:hypothetical protein [Micromonospora sp. NPDC049282]|uniref:hypothetical protein n=1 Tax=Micromonospora sp. NPDC049282 TaxID=3364269 RepID=UPI003716D534